SNAIAGGAARPRRVTPLLSYRAGATRSRVLRVPVRHLEAGDLTLDAGASRYVARVHRLREGDPLVLFHPREAREADATIIGIQRSVVRCHVREVRASTLPARPPGDLLPGAR